MPYIMLNKVWLFFSLFLAGIVTFKVLFMNKKIRATHFMSILLGFIAFSVYETFELYFLVRGSENPFSNFIITVIGFFFVYGFLGGLRHE